MEKPTCKTCAYWSKWHAIEGSDLHMGICYRYAPGRNPQMDELSEDCFCGEHPHFPAWLDSAVSTTQSDEV